LGALSWRPTADGSPTLWSEAFGEAFHSAEGARLEAERKFVAPAQLERFPPGHCLQVLDLCVGLGYNSAALLEAAQERGLAIQWWGLELDPRPLQLALADPSFRRCWRPATLGALDQLGANGHWRLKAGAPAANQDRGLGEPSGTAPQDSWGRWWLGDARSQLAAVQAELAAQGQGGCDLVLHDAFSPAHCPQLWSLEFLRQLAQTLKPDGRLLTYCSAAAVRWSLRELGLELASLGPSSNPGATHGSTLGSTHQAPDEQPASELPGAQGSQPSPPSASGLADNEFRTQPQNDLQNELQNDSQNELQAGVPATSPTTETPGAPSPSVPRAWPSKSWSYGTVASPQPLSPDPRGLLRPLSPMEQDHLSSRAAEPYRDPTGQATAAAILSARQQAQASHPGPSTSAWRRRWGLVRRPGISPDATP
jgi:SAM-dependent methyltransferase